MPWHLRILKGDSVRNAFRLPNEDVGDITVLDKICILLLALSPILQHYKAVFDNAGTMAMIVAYCYFGIRLLRVKRWRFGVVLPLILVSVYKIVNHGTGIKEIAREGLLIAYFIAAASGVINLKYFVKVVTRVAMVASGLLIVQYFCYYVLGFHLQLVPTSLLDDSAEQWILLAQTGRISVTGKMMSFYRPSAFFLEPSHMTLYSFSALAMIVLSEKFDRKHIVSAVLVSAGILLSTSGMGIALVFGIWGIYVFKRLIGEGKPRDQIKRLIRPKTLIWFAAAASIFLALFCLVEPIRMSIIRIFYNSNGKSAIEGRMGTGIIAVRSLSGSEFWFGKQNWGNVHNWNMAGFFYMFYTQGFIGVLLSYVFYICSMFKAKKSSFWIAMILIGLSFVTIQTHAAYYMLFYVMILLSGYDEKKIRW